MNCGIFTFGSFNKEYGGQCKLLSQGLLKNKISPIKLVAKKNNSVVKYLFYILGLRSGLMFTGFGYKSKLPKNLINTKTIISFAQVLPWNLFFYSLFKKKKIIFWNDMPINKITEIYVSNIIWKKIIILISYFQKFFLKNKIVATNSYQFINQKKPSVVPRIIDNCFYKNLFIKTKTKNFSLVLIGNDFERKKFLYIINFIKNSFPDLNIYVVGKNKNKLKIKSTKKIYFLGQQSKKNLSKLFKKLNIFFTISISESEGAPITLLEVQASGGFSICTNKNGGKEYVPEECVFNDKIQLNKIINKILYSFKFRNYIKKKILKNLNHNKAQNIAAELLKY